MICQIKNRASYMYDFSFCNHDSHHDLPNFGIPPLHFLGVIQVSNMCTSHRNNGYPHKSDQRNGLSLEHIAKNLQNIYNHIQRVPVSVLQVIKLPPVATFVHQHSQKILQCYNKATFQHDHVIYQTKPLRNLKFRVPKITIFASSFQHTL
jgi:hypothetical protein